MAVAILAANRIQDQADFGSTPGAGNSGYSVTWNNSTSKFELTNVSGSGSVSSVFGRTGAVVAASGDYTAAQVTNAAAVNAANVFTAAQAITQSLSGDVLMGVTNTSANTSATCRFRLTNNLGTIGELGLYGSNFGNVNFANRLAYTCSTGMSFLTNNTVASGGTSTITFFTGGYDTPVRLTIGATGLLTTTITDAATNAITNAVVVGHNSTGTPAAGFGAGLKFTLKSSTTADQDAARLVALWDVATHASRSAALQILISNSSGEVNAATFDDDATAGNTRLLLYDVDNGQLERVSVGAADSGGTGYKVLRIAN